MKWALLTSFILLLTIIWFEPWATSKPKLVFVANDELSIRAQLEALQKPQPVVFPTLAESIKLPKLAKPIVVEHKNSYINNGEPILVLEETEVIEEYDEFAVFVARLQQHLQQGLSLAELTELYQQAQIAQWPVDWIFARLDNAYNFELSQTIDISILGKSFTQQQFSIPSLTTRINRQQFIQQSQAFLQLLNSCQSCKNKHELFGFLTVQRPLFTTTYSFRNIRGQQVNNATWLLMPRALAVVYDIQLAEFDFSNAAYKDKIDQAISLLLASDNLYYQQQGQFAQLMMYQDSHAFNDWFLEQENFSIGSYIHSAKYKLGINQTDIYRVVNGWLSQNIVRNDLELLMDFTIYHAQYFSISEAQDLLHKIQKHRDISDYPAWISFAHAMSLGYSTLGQKWKYEAKNTQPILNEVTENNASSPLITTLKPTLLFDMTHNRNINMIRSTWQQSFNSAKQAESAFAVMNWSTLDPKGAAGGPTGNGGFHFKSTFNNNVKALQQAGIKNNFDVVSTMHWRLAQLAIEADKKEQDISLYLAELNQIYPQLLASEQKWIDELL